jgi:hypothetical protein
MIYTTLELLRIADACKPSPRHLESKLGGIRTYGRDRPITIPQILDICGIDDALWALSAVHEDCAAEADRIARQMACAAVRRTPIGDGRTVWDLLADERSQNVVEVAERYAAGKATDKELADARADAWDASAASAAANAAAGAARAAASTAASVAADAVWAAANAAAGAAVSVAADAVWAAASAAARLYAWAEADAAWAAASSAIAAAKAAAEAVSAARKDEWDAADAVWAAAKAAAEAAWEAAEVAQAEILRELLSQLPKNGG